MCSRFQKMAEWLVIGISGVTCGGKTTLAHNLYDHFKSQGNLHLWNTPYIANDVQLMSQDDYFLPVHDSRHIWLEQLNAINFEVITALDMKQMLSDIIWLIEGRYLTKDHTDLKVSDKQPKSSQIDGKIASTNKQSQNLPIKEKHINILIIEGFLIFNQPELVKLCDIKFHMHLSYAKCLERRCKRIYDPPDIAGYFEMCVWPHYEKNFAELKDHNDIIILNGEICKQKISSYVLQKIAQHLEER